MRKAKNPKIFIVEDDRLYQEIIKSQLLTKNYSNIEVFNTGAECLDNLYKMPDIVLLDYNMDLTMNGLQVLKKIKTFNPDIQVIMLSAQDELDVAVNSMKYGAYDYVIKTEAAAERINGHIEKIGAWNDLFDENKKFKKTRMLVAVGVGIFIAIITLLNFLFPELFN